MVLFCKFEFKIINYILLKNKALQNNMDCENFSDRKCEDHYDYDPDNELGR